MSMFLTSISTKAVFPSINKNSTKDKPLWKFLEDNVERIFTSTLVRKSYFFPINFSWENLF